MTRASVERRTGPRSAHGYRLYGLSLRSQWALPCAREIAPGLLAKVELFGVSGSFFRDACRGVVMRSKRDAWFRYVRLKDGSDYLRWTRLFEFLVSADGRRIACRPLNGTSREAFHTYLLGQVLSFALLKQGTEPLHSTAVVVDRQAVGFVGDCGYGKSTLGAAFLQAEHPLLTDDLLVIKEDGRDFVAYSGLPRIKLFPHIARTLLGERVNGTPMNDRTSKRVIPLEQKMFWQAGAPLRAIYVVMPPSQGSRLDRIAIRTLPPRHAFRELLKNTFNTVIVEPKRLKRQFEFAARLAREIPVKSLSFPRELARLPAVREAVLRDLVP